MDWKTCSISEYWFQKDYTTVRAYSFNCGRCYVARGSCFAQPNWRLWSGFFFNCLNLTFGVAFVFDLLVLGKGLPGYSYMTSFQRCSWKKAPWPLRQQSDRPNLGTTSASVLLIGREKMPVDCPASQPYAIRVTVFKLKCSHKLNVQ